MDNCKVFEVLSKDLESLQAALNRYEELLLGKPEKPGTVKEFVDYYRTQALNVRNTLLRMCAGTPDEGDSLVSFKKAAVAKTVELVEDDGDDDEGDPQLP